MNTSETFKELEKELDEKLNNLSIWKLPFQVVMSWLFLAIEKFDYEKKTDVAADLTSRLSYVYPIIRNKCVKHPFANSSEAILAIDYFAHADDINFLLAYAHYSLIMPQFHRGTFKATKVVDRHYKIEFPNSGYESAEIIDRVYSYLSQQVVLNYNKQPDLENYLQQRVSKRVPSFNGEDFAHIIEMQHFYRKTSLNIRIIPDDIMTKVLGFNYDEYLDFSATVQAFCMFFKLLARAYRLASETDKNQADYLMTEYYEWSVCGLSKNILGWFINVSGLSKEKLLSIFQFYLTIDSNTSEEPIQEKAFCGDGYFPPFIWIENNLVFSAPGTMFMLTFNNIVYSLNKKDPKVFSTIVSPVLEPTLINQVRYLFSHIPDLALRSNINYDMGEIDFVVYSEIENTAICLQVKATVAPDSGRTVQRVEDRAIEGMNQVVRFDELPQQEKDKIINQAFGIAKSNIHCIGILLMRSCAGSAPAWQNNSRTPIVNYTTLALVIAQMLDERQTKVSTLVERIHKMQEALSIDSAGKVVYETLQIGGYTIEFPNVYTDPAYILTTHTHILKHIPDFEMLD